jgi:hypothetical protein
MFKDRFDLLPGHARKPIQELIDSGAAFEVLKESRNRNPSASE